MKLSRIYIGTGYDKDGSRLTAESRRNAIAALDATAVDTFGGFTRFEATGGWKSPSGGVALEESIVYEIGVEVPVHGFAGYAKFLLNQQSVYIVTTDVSTESV